MFDNTPIYKFLEQVRSQIRYRPAADKVCRELTEHMEDRMDDLAAHGVPGREAAERAVAAMGDPYELGQEIDWLYPVFWHQFSGVLLAITIGLLLGALVNNLTEWNGATPVTHLLPATSHVTLDRALFPAEDGSPTLVRPATVFGEGRLGAYTLAPADDGGTAGLYRRSDGLLQLRFALTVRSAAPWLGDSPTTAYTAVDDLGRTYDISSWDLTHDSVTRNTALLLLSPDDTAARVYTVTAAGQDGSSVTFHVHCGEEVSP